MTRLTSGDRGVLWRIQAVAERLGPGQSYEVAIHPDRAPHILSHGALERSRTLLDPPPLFGVSGYLDARVLLHGDADGWQAERLGDGPRGLRSWARGQDWAEVLCLDLADGETLEVGPDPPAHARAALARAVAPLGASTPAASMLSGGIGGLVRDDASPSAHRRLADAPLALLPAKTRAEIDAALERGPPGQQIFGRHPPKRLVSLASGPFRLLWQPGGDDPACGFHGAVAV